MAAETTKITVGEAFEGPRGPRNLITVGEGEATYYYVASTGVNFFGGTELMVFPADADGEISQYREIALVDSVEEAVAEIRDYHEI